MVIWFPEDNQKSALIQWTVNGCSSFSARLPLRTRITLHPVSFSHTIHMFWLRHLWHPFLHHYGLFVGLQAIFVSCNCSFPYSSLSCHQCPSRHPVSIMLETWMLFRHAISVEAALNRAKHWTTTSVFQHCFKRKDVQYSKSYRQQDAY